MIDWLFGLPMRVLVIVAVLAVMALGALVSWLFLRAVDRPVTACPNCGGTERVFIGALGNGYEYVTDCARCRRGEVRA